MANTIQLRRSATANAVPTTTQLQLGELAINTYDGKLYLKKNVSGTESIVQIGSNADQLGGFVRDRFVYGDNTTGSINSFTGDGGVGANSLSRSCFYRDNSGQFGALGVHIQHPQNNAYALQIASSAYENGPLRYRVENNGTWSSPFTILDSANYNSYSPTLTGTGASGTWGISISGSAPTLTTARTLTIGSMGKTFNGSANVAWSLAEIGAEYQQTLGVPRVNLGDPTVREMALFDSQFNNKTEFYPPANVICETSTDGVTWSTYSVTDAQKKALVGGDSGASISITNGTAYFRVRFINNGNYVYLNALYVYHTSGGHSTKVQIYRKDYGSTTWVQHTNSNDLVGSWPGHIYLPFSTIAYHPSTYVNEVAIVFIPTWNASWPAQNITLHQMQIWGGYPAGKRNVYAVDSDKNVTFPQAVSTSAGDITSSNNLISTNGRVYLNNTGTNYIVANSGGASSVLSIEAGSLLIRDYAGINTRLAITSSGEIQANGNNLFNANLKSYTEHKVTNSAATGTVTLDLSTSNVFQVTLTGNTTFAFSNPPANTKVFSFTIIATQDATGGRTITWPTSKKFAGGVTPPPTTTANAIDIWSVMTYDGGASYIVSLSVKDAK